MGFKTPNSSSSLPQSTIQQPLLPPGIAGHNGRRSRSSGDFKIPLVAAANSRKNRLPQSTLHKIFGIMLLVVFVMYTILMVCFVYSGHSDSSAFESKWGPSIAQSDQVRKNHWESLRYIQQQQQNESPATTKQQERILSQEDNKVMNPEDTPVLSSVSNTLNKAVHDTVGREAVEGAAVVAHDNEFEEFDIHDMKRPPSQAQNSSGESKMITPEKSKLLSNEQKLGDEQHGEPKKLTAYLEQTNLDDWNIKPLPIRSETTAKSELLRKVIYSNANTQCSKLIENWPTDDSPSVHDPFLPWIHDVFPTDDGRNIQFVAQNQRRCQTGTTSEQRQILEQMQPQVSLFQHVPVKRINTTEQGQEIRYQLTTHEDADKDGIETRFICQFVSSTGEEEATLSRHNINYDFAAYRKGQKHTFTKEGRDNKSIHTSQLIFQCPVPPNLAKSIQYGTHVIDDQPTLFVNLIPIRTPPRYGKPNRFLPPYYQESATYAKTQHNFTVKEEWGTNHVLPKIEDSGRWENVPICLPTSRAFPDVSMIPPPTDSELENMNIIEKPQRKPDNIMSADNHRNTGRHRLVATTWASAGYATRGERFAINDGIRRLDEWIRFHLLVGVDHVIVYDNSQANGNDATTTLESVTNQFPSTQVTRIAWPASVCNNNKSFDDSPGERSSQYAAESSWRLRFGPYTDWMASMDIDEYIVPVGTYTSLKPFLDSLDSNQTKIVSFGSWRAWPRREYIEQPMPIINKTICDEPLPCFELHVPADHSILQTYNCDRQQEKAQKIPAEKQIYRPDYVLQHFVHYSTITRLGQMNQQDFENVSSAFNYHKRISPDPLSRFADERTEVTMLHTKSIATQDTAGWQTRCTGEAKRGTCRIGVPYPYATTGDDNQSNNTAVVVNPGDNSGNKTKDEKGWLYNCYVNNKIENYWVPLLDEALKDSHIV